MVLSDIRMWIVNIVNLCGPSFPDLLVAWWDVADWMEQEIIVSRSHEHCTKCQILHHNTRHTIQPTVYSQYSAGRWTRVWTQLNLIPASAGAGSSALCCSAVSSWTLLHSATLAPTRQPPHMRHPLQSTVHTALGLGGNSMRIMSHLQYQIFWHIHSNKIHHQHSIFNMLIKLQNMHMEYHEGR